MTLLYAIGVGALVNVAVAIVGRLLRFANVRFDPSGESIVVGLAAAVIVASVGLAARREHVRLALLGLAVHAALLINRVLGVAFNGRTPGDGSINAFQFTPLALALLIGAFVLGIAAGLIFRGFRPQLPSWRAPARLVRAAGVAYVVGTIVGLVWYGPRRSSRRCSVTQISRQQCCRCRWSSPAPWWAVPTHRARASITGALLSSAHT
jgi:hypothetical protein